MSEEEIKAENNRLRKELKQAREDVKGRLPPTEPESWRMGDAPYKLF